MQVEQKLHLKKIYKSFPKKNFFLCILQKIAKVYFTCSITFNNFGLKPAILISFEESSTSDPFYTVPSPPLTLLSHAVHLDNEGLLGTIPYSIKFRNVPVVDTHSNSTKNREFIPIIVFFTKTCVLRLRNSQRRVFVYIIC